MFTVVVAFTQCEWWMENFNTRCDRNKVNCKLVSQPCLSENHVEDSLKPLKTDHLKMLKGRPAWWLGNKQCCFTVKNVSGLSRDRRRLCLVCMFYLCLFVFPLGTQASYHRPITCM